LLTITIGTITGGVSVISFKVTNFVNPASSLDQWPTGGLTGFNITYFDSSNTLLATYNYAKLGGYSATPLTAASLVPFDAA
jgi:hypothetical protein